MTIEDGIGLDAVLKLNCPSVVCTFICKFIIKTGTVVTTEAFQYNLCINLKWCHYMKS